MRAARSRSGPCSRRSATATDRRWRDGRRSVARPRNHDGPARLAADRAVFAGRPHDVVWRLASRRDYQVRPRPPPPPPPPPQPPPPPPLERGLFSASFTRIGRPSSMAPFIAWIALAQSAGSANVTKPKPRLLPVSRSSTTFASVIVPCAA